MKCRRTTIGSLPRTLLRASLLLLLVLSCSSSRQEQLDRYFNVYVSLQQKNVTIDNFTNVSEDDITGTIDGTEIIRGTRGFTWASTSSFTVGQRLHAVFSHTTWGAVEFDLVIPDGPSAIECTPDPDTWLGKLRDVDTGNDSITVTWPALTHCNFVTGLLGGIRTAFEDGMHINGLWQQSSLLFANDAADGTWTRVRDRILAEEGFQVFTSFERRDEIAWAGQAKIYAATVAEQLSCSGRMPLDVSGVYDLSASYTATNGAFRVDMNGIGDVLTINQAGTVLSVAGNPGVSGAITGTTLTLTGPVLGEGSQSFSGQIAGNTIAGSVDGTVMAQFPGSSQPMLSDISSGGFTLTKRN